MRLTVSPTRVASRVLSVLLLAIPLVLIVQTVDAYEQEMIATLTHQELLDYLKEGQGQSFLGGYAAIGGLSLAYLALVEAVAFVLRLGMGLLRRHEAPDPAPVVSY